MAFKWLRKWFTTKPTKMCLLFTRGFFFFIPKEDSVTIIFKCVSKYKDDYEFRVLSNNFDITNQYSRANRATNYVKRSCKHLAWRSFTKNKVIQLSPLDYRGEQDKLSTLVSHGWPVFKNEREKRACQQERTMDFLQLNYRTFGRLSAIFGYND